MAITKTDFINYTRCRRYSALETVRKDKLSSKVSLEEYKNQEENESINEILSSIFDDEDNDLTEKIDEQLQSMMEYYKEVELLAGYHIEKIFKGKSIYSLSTHNQESFDFIKNGIRYMCYVDIYNENDNEINIIEVKATTSKKMLDVTVGKDKKPLFIFDNNIYKLNKSLESDPDYNKKINKLKDRYRDGKYIYDLAVQRNFIEGDLISHKINKKINYYLAVLNSDYTYDGYTENDKRIYRSDKYGNEIISIFDMNDITASMMNIIEKEREELEYNIFNSDSSPCKVSISCALKKNNECRYKGICFKDVPSKNASFNYKNFRMFTDDRGTKYDKYDLINEGYLKLSDVPKEWLKNYNHIIQRECFEKNEIYINKNKIQAALENLNYPIYHLDFETFPCPLPRFKGEKCYTQSPFEFSLHIEQEPGVCDKDKDNYIFMASSFKDERKELARALINNIDGKKGVMLAQNVRFEKSVIKHLSEIFPEYKNQLLEIYNNSTDLLYIIENNKNFYEEKGFNEYDYETVNYYNTLQSGSFSIKYTLPLFSDLKYSDLEVKNGTGAIVEYSKFKNMSESEIEKSRKALIEYCKQDTWAMFEILKGLRKLTVVEEVVK